MDNPIIEFGAVAIVVVVGVYFVVLGALALFAPATAKRFLLGFASSVSTHYAELLVRMVVGGAFLIHSPDMLFPVAFKLFGWVLMGTTGCLLLVPWQWPQRFADQAVPRATRYITLIGVCSLALGGFVLVAVTQ